MQRYFVNEFDNNTFKLNEDDTYHITKVMRMKVKDSIEVVYNNELYICEINSFTPYVTCSILEKVNESFIEQPKVIIAQAIVKEQKMDYILQKSCELGVYSIVPFQAERSIIKLDKDTVVTGKLYYPEDAKVSGLKDAKVGSVKLMKSKDIETRDTATFKDKVMDFIISVAASFIVMIVLFYLIPNTKEKLEKVDLKVSSILKLVGIGLVVLIVVPIIALIGLFTGVLTPIALITICLYVIFIYLSSLLGYYIVGNVIISKTLEKGNSYLALFCGIIIVKLVKLIPVIGGLVSALLLFYGIGLIYKYIISIRK